MFIKIYFTYSRLNLVNSTLLNLKKVSLCARARPQGIFEYSVSLKLV